MWRVVTRASEASRMPHRLAVPSREHRNRTDPPRFSTRLVRHLRSTSARRERRETETLLVAGEREGERVHACKKARNRDAERDEFANEAGRRLSPAPTVATRTLYNRRLPIFRARVIRMRDRR